MSMKDKTIRIDDWAGNLLFIGPYDDEDVDKVLDANRCDCGDNMQVNRNPIRKECLKCDETGYVGDFEVSWVDEDNNELNVYEYINY